MSTQSLVWLIIVFALLIFWHKFSTKRETFADIRPDLIQCENCGHIDDYCNFDPICTDNHTYLNDTYLCPACDDWTFENPVEPQ